MRDFYDTREDIINIIIRLEKFTANDLKCELYRIFGNDEVVINIAEELLLTHPQIKSVFDIYIWESDVR